MRITNADNDEAIVFSVALKSQIMTLRRELGKQTPARIVPHPPIPRAQPVKAFDERIPLVKQQSTTPQKDNFTQGSRSTRQLPLPTDVSDDSPLFSRVTRIIHQLPANSPGPRATEKLYGAVRTPPGRPFPQGCVLHAPPSAYPQAMPGSLPSTSPDPLQDPIYPGWHGVPVRTSASTSGVGISPRNPFSIDNPRLVKIDDDDHAEESSDSTDRDI